MGLLAQAMFGGGGREMKSGDATLELFKQVFGTNTAGTGDNITWKSALQVSTVLACTNKIANGISQVPLKLFKGKEEEARDHSLFRVLHRRPNPWQTSFEYRQTIALHLVLCGNHFSFKNAPDGRILELMPIEPGNVEVKRRGGELIYRVKFGDAKPEDFPAPAIWHLRGASWNGWMGMEPVQLAREAIGLAVATERQHSTFHKNGVSTSGVYSVEGNLDDKQYKQLRKFIADNYSGANRGLPMIMDRNAKWLSQAMSGVDAQHLETRNFQVEQICSAMNVHPFMIGHAGNTTTFASAEQASINHVVHTLAPLYELIEQSIDNNLLTERDYRAGIYAKFIAEGLMRGSLDAMATMLDKYVNGGLMTPNEARAKLEMRPDPDPASNKLRVPANIVGKPPAGGSASGGLPA